MPARVLIIEDNQANMDLMSYLLTAFGHTPLEAYDGEQGLGMARAERPDLIICDIHLPKLDGYGVVRQLKAEPQCAAIPVLAASALPVTDGGAALRAAGFDGHLPKSLEPDTLIPSLEAYLPVALRRVAIPAVAPSSDGPPAAVEAGGQAPRCRVLLLDAAPDDCGLVASLLAHYGYAVSVAADAGQAAYHAGREFDLLLCDVDTSRPHADGFPARALAQWPALPLLLVRSAADEPVAALLEGAAARPQVVLLSHPLEPQQLAGALEQCLRPAG